MKNKITLNLVRYKKGYNVHYLVLTGGALNPITFIIIFYLWSTKMCKPLS